MVSDRTSASAWGKRVGRRKRRDGGIGRVCEWFFVGTRRQHEAAARALQEMGCDYGQGYYFSEPIEAELALQRLRTQHPFQPPAQATGTFAPQKDTTADGTNLFQFVGVPTQDFIFVAGSIPTLHQEGTFERGRIFVVGAAARGVYGDIYARYLDLAGVQPGD